MTDEPGPKRPHVVHMTSVHDIRDPRIFVKQCRSLARAGYRVTLVAVADSDATVDGVEIKAVRGEKSRLRRMLLTAARVYRAARSLDAHIYHFHDPELIPFGLLLAFSGKPVIYDIHEDYFTSLKQKRYLPLPLRALVANAFRMFENIATKKFRCVIAEAYYQERFPRATRVLNYPVLVPTLVSAAACDPTSLRLLYTGNVTPDRGALNHARLVAHHPTLSVRMFGRCPADLAERLALTAGGGASRLSITGVGAYLDPRVIQEAYANGGWLAGLALFPDTEHYRRKVLTKLFEYMMAGLPVLCSDFPMWRAFVEEFDCGIAVDPSSPEAAIEAVERLWHHPQRTREMGLRGRQAVLTKFTWESEADALLRLYDRLAPTAGGTIELRPG